MRSVAGLQVWERAHALVVEVYKATASFPATERYGLTAQLRRAVVSVPANIAEGAKRRSQRHFAHFLNTAEGSLAEAQYLLLLSKDLGFLGAALADPLLAETEEILRMLSGLRTRVEAAE